MRRGTVARINSARGMVAISTEDDGFTIVQLLSDWELEIGDSISWKSGYGLGDELYANLSKDSSERVYVQNHGVGRRQLDEQMR